MDFDCLWDGRSTACFATGSEPRVPDFPAQAISANALHIVLSLSQTQSESKDSSLPGHRLLSCIALLLIREAEQELSRLDC